MKYHFTLQCRLFTFLWRVINHYRETLTTPTLHMYCIRVSKVHWCFKKTAFIWDETLRTHLHSARLNKFVIRDEADPKLCFPFAQFVATRVTLTVGHEKNAVGPHENNHIAMADGSRWGYMSVEIASPHVTGLYKRRSQCLCNQLKWRHSYWYWEFCEAAIVDT